MACSKETISDSDDPLLLQRRLKISVVRFVGVCTAPSFKYLGKKSRKASFALIDRSIICFFDSACRNDPNKLSKLSGMMMDDRVSTMRCLLGSVLVGRRLLLISR